MVGLTWLLVILAIQPATAVKKPTATKPVMVGTGGGKKLAIFPSSVQKIPGTSEIMVIAQGNTDAEYPRGGFGREFSSKDGGATWREVGPPNPSDGYPRKGVSCLTRSHDLLCLPFRFDPTNSPNVGTATGMLWAGSPPAWVGNQTVTVRIDAPGGTSGSHWGMVPDMDHPVDVHINGKPSKLTILYGHYGGYNGTANVHYNLVAVVSEDDGTSWTQLSVIKNNSGIDDTGSCSNPSEDALTRLPDGRLVILYRNRDGTATDWSENIPLCMQFSSDEGSTWSSPKVIADGPHGVEPKAAVVGDQLLVLGGRDGLYVWSVLVDQVETGPWSVFNIAEHHNYFFNNTDLAFSQATVAGTGGSQETTAYMGLRVLDNGEALVCYDRTTSHLESRIHETDAMAQNTVFCFSLNYGKRVAFLHV